MSSDTAAFILNIAGTFVATGVLTGLYIWPAIRKLPNGEALRILALPHAFRFVGLAFLIDGVVSPELDSEITTPAAWGDFCAAILAILLITALTWRWRFVILLAWLFNLWGTVDLLNAYVLGIALDTEPGLFGAAYFIPAVIVPPLLVGHGLIFAVLLRRDDAPERELRPIV
jgi:hypothetical protein